MNSKYPDFLVSIHCMTYNHAPFIEDAMNGFCMQQTSFPYVAIIIDDASTDGEPEVIRRYLDIHFDMRKAEKWETDDAHFIYAHHQNNHNCYFFVILLKYNFRQAKKDKAPLYIEFEEKAKYIALCEGDDYWIDEKKLQMQTSFLIANTDYSLCVHASKRQYHSTGEIKYVPKEKLKDYPHGFDISLSYNVFHWCTQSLTAVYDKHKLAQTNYFKCRKTRDTVLFYYLLQTGKAFFMPNIMSVYRIHPNGICSGQSFFTNATEELLCYFEIYNCEKTAQSKKICICKILLYMPDFVIHREWKSIMRISKLVSNNLGIFYIFICGLYLPFAIIRNYLYSFVKKWFVKKI